MREMSVGIMLGVGDNPRDSFEKANRVGVDNAQFGCPADKYLAGEGLDELRQLITDSGVTITVVFCGFEGESYADIPAVQRTVGYVPEATRLARLDKTRQISDFARAMGVDYVAAHIGFVPEEPDNPTYGQMVEAVREVCDYCKGNGQCFSLETGQETAETLLEFIKDVDRDNLRVNFDPANMILYGSGEPIAALKLVGKYVTSVHCKDGTWPTEKDQLGHETPLGEGDVGIPKLIATLKEIGYKGPLTIEREITGEQQIADMIVAKEYLERLRDEA